MPSNTTLMRDGALGLASRGLRVHPLIARGKMPITPHGVIDATTDHDQIVRWWTHTPHANIGIATGRGIVVIDLDSDQAESALLELEQQYGALPATRVAETGRGSHWYFRVPDDIVIRNKVKIAPDIDVRGDGGFVVAPPSVHENGTTYGWRFDRPTAMLPDQWIELLRAPSDRGPIDLGDNSPIPIGQQNDEIFRRVSKLRGQGVEIETARIYVRGLDIPNDPARDPWTDADLDAIVERVYTAYQAGERPAAVRHSAGSTQRQGEAPRTAASNEGGIRLVEASTIEPLAISWAWDGRIPLGMLTLIVGQGGTGKSMETDRLAAGFSQGTIAGSLWGEPVDVAIASAEDHRAVTIVPRLKAAGADLTRVHFVEAFDADGDADDMAINGEVAKLEQACLASGVKVLIIDTIVAHIPTATDSYKEQHVRAVLKPLAHMAERLGMAIIGIMHLNRREAKDVLTRISGSGGFGNLARSVLLFARDPEQPEDSLERILAHAKCNVGPLKPAMRLRLESYEVGDIVTARLVLGDEVSISTSALLAGSEDEGSAMDAAVTWLHDRLAAHPEGIPAKTMLDEAVNGEGIAAKTLERARTKLGVKSSKSGFAGWVWQLPEPTTPRRGAPAPF